MHLADRRKRRWRRYSFLLKVLVQKLHASLVLAVQWLKLHHLVPLNCITSVIILPRISKFISHDKQQTESNGGTFYIVTRLYSSKILGPWKTRKDWRTISNWRALFLYDNEWNSWSWIGSWPKKCIYVCIWDNYENLNVVFGQNINNGSMFTTSFWWYFVPMWEKIF